MKPALAIVAAILLLASSAPTLAGWAVAYGPSKRWLTVYAGVNSSSQARKLTLHDCSENAPDCELVGSGWNGCFAFARAAKTGPAWGFSEGKNDHLAAAAALKQCRSRASGNCEVMYKHCDGSGGFSPEYESFRQFDAWQKVVDEYGLKSAEAKGVCLELNRDLASRSQPPCMCR